MIEYHNSRPTGIVGPDSRLLTPDMLPPADTTRWVAHRKAQVVAAVESGMLTIDEVIERYGLSLEEFSGWQRAMDRSGVAGLRIAALQKDREGYRRASRKIAGRHLRLVTH
ncbi:DUF1153 domain-containing protein [Novosphingobium sp. TH158]|uniref:CtrA inhibitor SciP n=1 Tax=Novosphingobium sp. TH158 TaxID=2067455 RepID=UPI000C7AF646|nr:DUF1153 domain-containing protein [Novosphingobium sp. TH158]PLK25667.1 DUF1153 domain-containing protein [Novosphingobium sp. TH158]